MKAACSPRVCLGALAVLALLAAPAYAQRTAAPISDIGSTLQMPKAVDRERATAALNELSIRFEPTDQKGTFVARGVGSAVRLTGRSIDFPTGSNATDADSIRIQFVGSRKSSRVNGDGPLPGQVNYFYGDDPRNWRRNVRSYARALAKDVYRGVDVLYYGAGDQLEYDLIVRPGAQPDVIRLAIDDLSARISESGDLTYGVDQRILLRKPIAYQTIDGVRREVTAEYRLHGDGTVQFKLGAYDHDRTLVIDPLVAYSFTFGGSRDDSVQDIAVDDAGALYVSGYTSSRDFPTVRAYQPVPGQTCQPGLGLCTDGFLVKIRPDGGWFEYATYFSRGPRTIIDHIAVDPNHALYFSGDGNYISSPFSPAPFIAKLSPNGTDLVYVVSPPILLPNLVTPPTPVTDLAVSADGTVYITTPTTVATLSANGTNYHAIFDALSGHSLADVLAPTTFTTIAVAAGSVFAAGNTSWASFPTTLGAAQASHHSHLMWTIGDEGAQPASDHGLENWYDVTQIAVSPADSEVRYAAGMSGWPASSRGQIARSTDAGQSWTVLNTPSVGDPQLVLSNLDPLTAYVFSRGVQSALWKTTDGGVTFTSLPFAGVVSALSISSDDSSLYLAAGPDWTGGGVYKSVNGGTTWTSLPWPSDYHFLKIDSRIPARIYAVQVGPGALRRTADDGATWQSIDAEYDVTVSPSVPTTIYGTLDSRTLRKSTDDGVTWQTVLTDSSGSIYAGIVHPTSPDVVVFATGSGLRRSSDGGATWSTVLKIFTVGNFVFDPSDPGVILGTRTRVEDGFVMRITPQGAIEYSTFLGGVYSDRIANVAVDAQGSAHVVGDTASPDFPSMRPVTRNPDAPYHTFVVKLSPDASSIVYARQLGNGSVDGTGATGLGFDLLPLGLDNNGHARTAACSKPDGDFPSYDCRSYLLSASGTLLESTATGDPPSPLVSVDPSGSSYFVRKLFGASVKVGVTKYTDTFNELPFLTTNVPLPVRFGTPVTWTASTFWEDQAEYSFWHFSQASGWEQLQDFSQTRTVTWKPASWDVGDNLVRVYARALGSTAWPVQASMSFIVLGVQAGEAPVLPSAADFNGDQRPDLVWINSATGQLAMWNVGGGEHGERVLSGGYLAGAALPAGWRVAGAGDIDGDGHTDLFLQSDSGFLGAWFFDGSTLRNGITLTPGQVGDPNWQIRAVGDLNHDGHPDLIWQYAPTGQVAFWLMNGTNAIAYIVPNVDAPGSDWEIVGTGDSNRDGERDIFWQQRSTGTLAVWWMNGTTIAGASLLSSSPDPKWRVVGVVDLDGDAYSDLVFQHADSHLTAAWYLQGSLVRSGVMLNPSTVGDPAWKIVGPR